MKNKVRIDYWPAIFSMLSIFAGWEILNSRVFFVYTDTPCPEFIKNIFAIFFIIIGSIIIVITIIQVFLNWSIRSDVSK